MANSEEIQEQQRQTWDRFSAGWTKWDDLVLRMLQPAGDEIIRVLKLQDENEHLDVATGTGEPGLSIAARLPQRSRCADRCVRGNACRGGGQREVARVDQC